MKLKTVNNREVLLSSNLYFDNNRKPSIGINIYFPEDQSCRRFTPRLLSLFKLKDKAKVINWHIKLCRMELNEINKYWDENFPF